MNRDGENLCLHVIDEESNKDHDFDADKNNFIVHVDLEGMLQHRSLQEKLILCHVTCLERNVSHSKFLSICSITVCSL